MKQKCSLRSFLLSFLLFIFIVQIGFLSLWARDGYNGYQEVVSEESIGNFTQSIKPHSLPFNSKWTYKCESEACVRYLYSQSVGTSKRVPFLTCTMTCGGAKIWPKPTVKAVVGSKSLTFLPESVQLQLQASNDDVKTQLNNVFVLFLNDLSRLQGPNIKPKKKKSAQLKSWTHDQIVYFKVIMETKSIGNLNMNLDTDESYRLSVTVKKRTLNAHIIANSYFGARYGLSTLLQLIWFDDEDKMLRILSKALIVDAPKFRYRGLMLDTSRHYFSVEAIKRTIVGMSHAKLNRFHWHITDSQSFPYVSKYYPELAAHGAYSDYETYTQEDIREVARFANLHGVQVIPEIDAPAHAGNGWDWGPKRGLGDLSLCINQQPWNIYCGEPPCGQLNPKNNNTYLILQRLYEELLNLTGPTDYFHLGGDEVNMKCWRQHFKKTNLVQTWCDFMLKAKSRLKIANNFVEPKFIGVWSSGLTQSTCLPEKQFVVQIWFGSKRMENYDIINAGYNVIFSHVDAWYLDCGFGNWRSVEKGVCSPYRTWQDVYFNRPWTDLNLNSSQIERVLGGEVCLWTEQVNENQLDSRLWPRSAALGERLWSDPEYEKERNIAPQGAFGRLSIFRERLEQFGIKAEPIFPKYCELNLNKC